MPAISPESLKVAAVLLVLTGEKGPRGSVPRETVYPVASATTPHDTLMVPLLLSAVAETPVGTAGGTQAGLAETSLELAEVQLPLLALTT